MVLLFGACQKKAQTPQNSLSNYAILDGDSLVGNVGTFYERMKELHSRTPGEDVTYTLEEANFYIEASYNYEVARLDEVSEGEYRGFSFEVPVGSSETLSEYEVAQNMYRIKDSLLVTFNNISYSDKHLSLFDLEITHDAGTSTATFEVDYSITNSAPVTDSSANGTTVSGTEESAWAVLENPCGSARYMIFPSYSGLQIHLNSYYKGIGNLNYSNSSLVTGSQNCSSPGAAVILRSKGISNYRLASGSNTGRYFAVNIASFKFETPVVTNINHDYTNRGIAYYKNTDQYYIQGVPENSNGSLNLNGTAFYCQWLKTSMMNFYLSFISTKIAAKIPNGKYFYDFQIGRQQTSGLGNQDHMHFYNYYYGDKTLVDLRPIAIKPLAYF